MPPPDLEQFLTFLTLHRTLCAPRSRVVVHCSAGLGRTGTFLALNRLYGHASTLPDVHRVISDLRHHRSPRMVQNAQQYAFILRVLDRPRIWSHTPHEPLAPDHYRYVHTDTGHYVEAPEFYYHGPFELMTIRHTPVRVLVPRLDLSSWAYQQPT